MLKTVLTNNNQNDNRGVVNYALKTCQFVVDSLWISGKVVQNSVLLTFYPQLTLVRLQHLYTVYDTR